MRTVQKLTKEHLNYNIKALNKEYKKTCNPKRIIKV